MSDKSIWDVIVDFFKSLFSKKNSDNNASDKVDALDVSDQSWRFAKKPIDDILKSVTYEAGGKKFKVTLKGKIPWPNRDANHDGNPVNCAASMIFVRNGKQVTGDVDSLHPGQSVQSMQNVTTGNRIPGMHPKKGEVIYWYLHSEDGPDRRSNIVKAEPYP